MKRASLLLLVFLFLGGPPTVWAALVEDFDGLPFTLTRHGSEPGPAIFTGGPDGNFLRLTSDVQSQTNTIAFYEVPSFSGPQIQGFKMQFDFRMSDDASLSNPGFHERADGFGVALMDTATYGSSGPGPASRAWERPSFPDAFAVGFDIFGVPQDGNTVSLNWDGAQVAEQFVTQLELNAGVFHHANVLVLPDGTDALVTMTITPDIFGTPGTPVTVFNNTLIPNMGLTSLPNFRAVFGGRTGASFVDTDLDNIDMRSIPIPGAVWLLGSGLIGLAGLRKKLEK